jgi:hypothetical protein
MGYLSIVGADVKLARRSRHELGVTNALGQSIAVFWFRQREVTGL